MKRQQIITAIIVFVVGFGLGYGATWVLVSDTDGPEVGADVSSTTGADAGATATPPRDGKDAANRAGAADATATSTDVARDAGPGEGRSDVASKVDTAAPLPVAAPWWKTCLGKRCEVDFGGIRGGLSVRRGSIKHGSTIDWNLRFRNAKRIDILPTDRSIVVILRAVGLDSKGDPVAAEIEWKTRRQNILGVISLRPGDKRVTMRPAAK